MMTPEFKQRLIAANTGMEGWCGPEKAIAMAELVLNEKPEVVVEIGVFGGRSLIPQAMALRENGRGMIYGMDPFKKSVAVEGVNDKRNDEWWESLNLHGICQSCLEHIWKNGLDEWCAVILAPSQNCKHLWPRIDILHIDGCHSELASVRDVNNYLPLVKPGGFVWFDDINWNTTQRALELVKAQSIDCGTIGNCTLYRKK